LAGNKNRTPLIVKALSFATGFGDDLVIETGLMPPTVISMFVIVFDKSKRGDFCSDDNRSSLRFGTRQICWHYQPSPYALISITNI
jgi:hypothetical protein